MDRQTREEIRLELTGPGGPFEIVGEDVLGEPMQVFKNRPRSLRELLSMTAARAEAEYLVHGDRRISYAEHLRLVASTARALQECYGIRPGDRVAILAANCVEWVVAFWATVSAGGIVAALNGWWTSEEIRYGVAHAEPKLLIGDERRLERLRRADLGVSVLRTGDFPDLLARFAAERLPEQPIDEDDPAVILYTSGTTGRPKGAVNSHRALVGFVQVNMLGGLERMMAALRGGAMAEASPPANCFLVSVPLFHLSGLYAMAVLGLAIGAKLVLRSGRFDPEDVLRLIERERVTMWSALGNTGQRVLAHPAFGRFDTSSLRNIGFGGAPTSPALQQRLRDAFPSAARNLGMGYGLSESGGIATTILGEELIERPTSVGRPSATHQIDIRDTDGRSLGEGEEGEIHIRSPYVMLDYWRDPQASARALRPGRWLATGDVGCLRDGYLYVNARARDMILRGAENIYPIEIENRLEAHPAVRESAVIGVDHPELGQEVKAIVVLRSDLSAGPEELRAWCAESLAAYKVPVHWEIRAEPLPRNAAGKVLKHVLRGEASNVFVEE